MDIQNRRGYAEYYNRHPIHSVLTVGRSVQRVGDEGNEEDLRARSGTGRGRLIPRRWSRAPDQAASAYLIFASFDSSSGPLISPTLVSRMMPLRSMKKLAGMPST